MFEWLDDRGVEFSSPRSLLFNVLCVDEVMIDRGMTEEQALDHVASLSAEEVDTYVSHLGFEPTFATSKREDPEVGTAARADSLDARCADARAASSAKAGATGPERQQENSL